VLLALADLFERHAGDRRRERRYLERVLALRLPADASARQQARRLLDRRAAEAERWAAQDDLLDRVKVERYSAEVFREQIVDLERAVARHPDYPQLAALYFHLGERQLRLGRDRQAYESFTRAEELKPAIGFTLPVPARRDRAYARWIRGDLAWTSWTVLGLFLLTTAAGTIFSRPWRHLGWRHAVVLAALVGGLLLALWGLVPAVAAIASLDVERYAEPVFLGTAPGSPLSGALDELFGYVLVGALGVIAFAVATSGLRRRWTRAFLGATAGLVLFAALLTHFFLRQDAVDYRPAEESGLRHLAGGLYYPLLSDQEPYILTDPLAYCRFQEKIGDLDEAAVSRWFAGYASACEERR
jgi:hypothetical protein